MKIKNKTKNKQEMKERKEKIYDRKQWKKKDNIKSKQGEEGRKKKRKERKDKIRKKRE